MTKQFKGKTLVMVLALALLLQLFAVLPMAPAAQAANTAVDPSNSYLSTVVNAEKTAQNEVLFTLQKGEKVKVIFYSDTVFRIWLAPDGNFTDPAWRQTTVASGRTPMIESLDFGALPTITLTDKDSFYEITSNALNLKAQKLALQFSLFSASGTAIWQESSPLSYGSNTFQCLSTATDEHFYGGGVQQGGWDFKNKTMVIRQGGWDEGGVSNPAPFYVSSKGYGAFRHTFSEGSYNFADQAELKQNENRFDCFYFYGPDMAAIINGYTKLTGRPALIPRWGMGLGEANIYKDSASGDINTKLVLPLADQYVANDMPFSFMIVNDGYMPAGDRGYRELPFVADELKKKGFRTGLWTSQGLSQIPFEVSQGLTRLYKLDVGWVYPAYDFGLNGGRLAAEGIENNSDARRYVIQCCGWAGTQRYATVWTGDQSSNWDYIRYHIATVTSAGLSGFAYTTSDVDSIYSGTAKTYTRDLQWKAFIPNTYVMSGWSGSVLKQPWFYGEPYTSINRKFLKLKQALTPYLYSYAFEASQNGSPIVRSLFFEFPEDKYTYTDATKYEFMSGKYMLVAPVYSDSNVRNGIYLPKGKWTDYWTGKDYIGGGTYNNVAAPIDTIPVFVRAGAIIPSYPNYTYAEKTPVDLVSFDLYPEGKTTFDLFEDDGSTRDYKSGKYMKTLITSNAPVAGQTGTLTITIGAAQGAAYEGMATTRNNELTVHTSQKPEFVQLGGTALIESATLAALKTAGTGWFFDAADRGGILYIYTGVQPIDQEKTVVVSTYTSQGVDELPETLDAPAGLNAQPVSHSEINVTWNAVAGATTYDVECDGLLYRGTASPFTLSNLLPETTHSFRVRAVSATGISPWTATVSAETAVDPYKYMVPKEKMNITATNYNSEGERPELAIDKNPNTYYHSIWTNPSSDPNAYPLNLTLEFDDYYTIKELRYLPRQDQPGGANGTVLGYRVQTSLDGINFTPVASGTWARNYNEKIATFAPVLAKYVRLDRMSSVGNFMSCAELTVIKDMDNPIVLKNFALNKPIDATSTWKTSLTTLYRIPSSQLQAIATNYEQAGNAYTPAAALDDNLNTYWHTKFDIPQGGSFPCELRIELNGDYTIGQVNYVPRDVGESGNVTEYAIYAYHPSYNDYVLIAGGKWEDDGIEKTIQFRPIMATKIKFVALNGTQGHGAAREIKVFHTGLVSETVKLEPSYDFAFSARSQISSNDVGMAFDGKNDTYYDSDYNNKVFPQYITMALSQPRRITQLNYIPRASSANGRMIKYNVLVSTDGTNFNSVSSGTWANTSTKKTVALTLDQPVKYVRLQADDTSFVYATSHLCVAELELYATPTGSSSGGGDEITVVPEPFNGWHIGNANDGSMTTMWSSTAAKDQEIIVDLLQPVDVKFVSMKWNRYLPRTVACQYSNDKETWTPIGATVNAAANTIITCNNEFRYLKVILNDSVLGSGVALAELQVMGADPQAVISPTEATFYTQEPENIPVTMNLFGHTFSAVYKGITALTPETDYQVDGQVVTLNGSYLKTLPVGRHTLTFRFADSMDRAFTVNVIGADKTALIAAIERFEALNEADYVASFYAAAKTVYDQAKAVRGDKAALQPAVDNATQKLNGAIDALVRKGTFVKFDANSSMSLKKGKTFVLDVLTDAYGPLTYSSSNPTTASVSSAGLVLGIKPGMALITVRTTDGSNLSASILVNVTL